ncbi:MAG TPA: geranylgeranylglyceryl/heptaprenylglyceryl phosphate synthase [Flavobacteriaceae bacterium]|jgi:putative glycerol-1-phosphate prenyltransferase|nr:geranylgeranylglyceryl/heptaprenylglyceryl phosphate synthase [Flavobacteriaceae bacterium]HIN99950.1 geranylgeranylglyceryl/heptaprenylglyceryl phosphate synthase [Flavobacteriaceae bacterium]|tara:strand:+ start:136778 stop:137491 length:714 start_codon:yes stop_codon:yes gene_type:complete
MKQSRYREIVEAVALQQKLLAVLVDPEQFQPELAAMFLTQIPKETTHLFVGGSSVPNGLTALVVESLKKHTNKPIVLFPGDASQITPQADALLFLSLLSGRNPEYLIGQQVKAIPAIKKSNLEIIATGYLLIDGGNSSAVARVTGTEPMAQHEVQLIVDTAKAGELLGAKLIYLEAGSGAAFPVSEEIIRAVKKELTIPLIVGGGIRTEAQKKKAYDAGADMVVMGTVFEQAMKNAQ